MPVPASALPCCCVSLLLRLCVLMCISNGIIIGLLYILYIQSSPIISGVLYGIMVGVLFFMPYFNATIIPYIKVYYSTKNKKYCPFLLPCKPVVLLRSVRLSK